MELKDIILETINTLETHAPQSEPDDQSLPNTDENLRTNPEEQASTAQSTQSKTPADEISAMWHKPFERDDTPKDTSAPHSTSSDSVAPVRPANSQARLKPSMIAVINESHSKQALSDEQTFLTLLQDRLLVLFEGLSMPDKQSQKLTMVLNFLQYQLSVISKRLENLKCDGKKE